LAALDHRMADYLIEPCLDAEIVWRVNRNLPTKDDLTGKAFTSLASDSVPTGQDVYPCLAQELGRSARQSDSLGLVIIKVRGWSLLVMDYGRNGAQIVEEIIIRRIQELVRTYDSLFRIEQGAYLTLLPHTAREGTAGFMHRIGQALSNILRSEAIAQHELESIRLEGIWAQTDMQTMPQPEAIEKVYAYILNRTASEKPGPPLVCLRIESEGFRLHEHSGQGRPP